MNSNIFCWIIWLMIYNNLFIALVAIIAVLTAVTPGMIYGQQSQNTTATTQGFGGPPTGPLTAVRHVFDDPSLRVWHFCKPNDKIMMVCQLYENNSPNATLIGVEYMITSDAYAALPAREKPNWHYHKEEFAPDTADPKFPQLSEQQQNASLKKLEETYGKVILTWNPSDKSPVYPPQIIQVQHPFMVNTTVTETMSGTFNQTRLK
jgi:hypothetical protein